MQPLKWILIRSQENAVIGLLILVGGIAAANDVFALIFPRNVGVYLIGLIFIAILIAQLLTELKIKSLAPLPSASDEGLFHPFMVSANQVWGRAEETRALTIQITKAAHTHVVVTGPSGAGKSTLVSKLVQPNLMLEFQVRSYRSYDDILLNIISDFGGPSDLLEMQAHVLNDYTEFTRARKCSVRDLFQPGCRVMGKTEEALWKQIERYFGTIFLGNQICFVFDQAERYVNMISNEIEKDTRDLNGYDVYFFREFLRFCRQRKECRSVFIIRAEYLYDSLDFLEITSGDESNISQKLISYFLCPGINVISAPDGVSQIRALFKSIPFAAEHFQRFERVSGLGGRAYSNTFMTQLFGMLVERFYCTDEAVKQMLLQEKDRSTALYIFFDHLLNDYRRETRSQDAIEVLKLVLFTVAIENRLTGQSVSCTRIAALAHIPLDAARDVLPFLRLKGILLTEDTQDDEVAYRVVHDIIIDYVIESGQLATDPLLKEEIRGLSDARTEIATCVSRYANLITDWGACA